MSNNPSSEALRASKPQPDSPVTILVRDLADRIGRHKTGVLRYLRKMNIEIIVTHAGQRNTWLYAVTEDDAERFLEDRRRNGFR
jgi:hypothetical protein